MAWFLNHYRCARCRKVWSDEWSCMCDDDCPECGARHMTPFDSADLTAMIVPDGDAFLVLRSADDAAHDPDYREAGRFATRAAAQKFANASAHALDNIPIMTIIRLSRS